MFLSAGETAIVSSERKSEGNMELLELLLAEDQKDLSVGEEMLSCFLRIKERFASR